jgi:hypothetical protein
MPNINSLDESVGLLKKGSIVKYLPDQNIIRVRLNNASASKGQQNLPLDIPAPHTMFYNNGLFMGTAPVEGTPVIVGQGSGGQYYFVSYLAEDLSVVPTLTDGQILIQSDDLTKITLDTDNNIYIGSDMNRVHYDTDSFLTTTSFDSVNSFSQATREVNGPVKRDVLYNTQFSQSNKLESDDYDSQFIVIGLDPTVTANNNVTGPVKNPPFIEDRELVYEFQYKSSVDDDVTEAAKYTPTTGGTNTSYTFPNRRLSRADTLSLSLVAPNYLMESVKGTVVDIFGNILDLNRYPLPIGQDQNTINSTASTNQQASFLLIKALERKSLAYHFEINARKDLTGTTVADVINSSVNYARARSRFFFDIDKEGQFKLNVPASSESGNIPLLTRYENYSTFGTDDNNNPNKLVYRTDNLDIFQDSFASPSLMPVNAGFLPDPDGSRGSITLTAGDGTNAGPMDRLTQTNIKHGTVFHDILQTCFVHQNNDYLNYQAGEENPLTVDLSQIPELTDIVSTTITTSGPSANAGGRSGSFNFDGSIELNIGANTVDRQSMWIDTAGGIVANIARDLNGRSIMAATGGDFYLQVGGFGISGDTRFDTAGINNGIMGAVLDLRILGDGGFCHMIRCDNNGITIMTPGNLAVHSKADMVLSSDHNIRIEAATVIIQERAVMKGFGGSI